MSIFIIILHNDAGICISTKMPETGKEEAKYLQLTQGVFSPEMHYIVGVIHVKGLGHNLGNRSRIHDEEITGKLSLLSFLRTDIY